VQEQIFYQIFPDRFCRGSAASLPDLSHRGHGEGGVARKWGSRPIKKQGWREFFGGDLAGIESKLDHLQELGITALYLNPIFDASSVHRYDTRDYTRIDPLLGGEGAYRSMVRALKSRGMRLVLDGVFNHTGDEFDGYTPDLTGSRASWYARSPGGQAFCWWAVPTLPKLNFASPEVVDSIYRAPDSIVRRWLYGPEGADGWRLDVPFCLGEGADETGNLRHLRGILEAAREANPEAYVFGEHFETAGAWLDARVHDATMNYSGFTFPTSEWICGRDYQGLGVDLAAEDLWQAWASHRHGRSHGQLAAAFNLLSSHDVSRVRTRLGGCLERSVLAHALLMTYPGVPSIYYGDELGMEGGEDPDCRRCYPWDQDPQEKPLWKALQTLAGLRSKREALRSGSMRPLWQDGAHLVFARQAGEEVVLVMANRGDQAASLQLDLRPLGLEQERFRDVLSGERWSLDSGRLKVRLRARSARVLDESGRGRLDKW
jgi:alpha-glucosidase